MARELRADIQPGRIVPVLGGAVRIEPLPMPSHFVDGSADTRNGDLRHLTEVHCGLLPIAATRAGAAV
jgi:hypothetical protein